MATEVQSPSVSGSADGEFSARSLVRLSGAFLVVQVLATYYGLGNSGAAVLWLVVGCLVLWAVYRKRSRLARGIVVVTSLVGAVIYGLSAVGDAHAAVLAVAYLGQAVPLLLSPVRRHVRTRH
jgi:4-hydroxybenzoate polyprenyltransferase